MSSRVAVSVEGLASFRRSLRVLDSELAKTIRLALNESANFLVGKAKPLIPRQSGAAADSLKARSTQSKVRIAAGGRKAPYYPWLDFGGQIGRKSGKAVGDRGVRPFLKDGRYLYPTLYANSKTFESILERSLTDVARRAGLDVD